MKLEKQDEISLPTGALALAVARDGSRLLAACMDGTVQLVDPAAKKAEPLPGSHTSFASGVVLLPDQNTVISAGYDGRLIWHDLAGKKTLRELKAHEFWSWRLALSADGSRVASVTGQYLAGGEKYEPAAEREPSVRIYDTATGELKHSFSHVPPVLSAAFSPDGKFFAAANMMGELRVWDLAGDPAKPVAQWTTPDFTSWGTTKSHHFCGGIYSLHFSADGKVLLGCGMGPMTDPMAGNGKMTWQRWAWQENPPKKIDQIHDGEHGAGLMEALAWRPDGSHFIMAGRQAQGTWNAALFDAASGALAASLDTKSRVTGAQFSPDGGTLWLSAAAGQPGPKDGKWPHYGRVYRCTVAA